MGMHWTKLFSRLVDKRQFTSPAGQTLPSSPLEHVNALFRLAMMNEAWGYRAFQCMPTRLSWVPSYMQIDAMILRQQILFDKSIYGNNIQESWSRVIDLRRRIFELGAIVHADRRVDTTVELWQRCGAHHG